MPCPKPQTCLRWGSHIEAMMEAEDLQGSSQGNPVWRSWGWAHTYHCPYSCDSNYPPSSKAGSLNQVRDRPRHGTNNSLVSLTIIICWCLLRIWSAFFWHLFLLERQGRDVPQPKVRQQEGWPKFPLLASQQNRKPSTGTRPHRSRLGSKNATMGLPGRDVAVWGGMLFISTKSKNLSSPSFPFLLTSPLPYQLKSCYSLSLFSTQDYFWLSYQPPPDW